ncbi:MAG: mycofactocin precursor MftA [Acidimicrobiales bacterium]
MTATDPSTTTEEPPAGEATGQPPAGEAVPAALVEAEAGPATLVEAELLVEEISIDGMCGVY